LSRRSGLLGLFGPELDDFQNSFGAQLGRDVLLGDVSLDLLKHLGVAVHLGDRLEHLVRGWLHLDRLGDGAQIGTLGAARLEPLDLDESGNLVAVILEKVAQRLGLLVDFVEALACHHVAL